ncbi:MAG: hypothetical protein ACRDNR_11490 [Gaiellaceae bacterium]
MSAPWVLAGSLLALPVAYVVWRLAVHELGSRAAALIAALATFGAVTVFPERVKTAVDGTQRFRALSVDVRDRYGGRVIADAQVFRTLRQRIPPDDTYYLQLEFPGPGVRPESGGSFRHWTLRWLLPRIAVASPEEADWVISRNADPETLGVEFEELEEIGTNISLGRVR